MKASRHADPPSSSSLRPLLAGGDCRSVAGSNRLLALVRASPDRVADVAALAKDPNWLVSMRALDLLEKLVHDDPEWIQPYRRVFIGPLADSDKWELHLQIVRALPFLRWTPRERSRVLAILRRDLAHPQLFVRAWALDSLAQFAADDPTLLPVVRRHLAAFIRSGRPALIARARKIGSRLRAERIATPPDVGGARPKSPLREASGVGTGMPRTPRRAGHWGTMREDALIEWLLDGDPAIRWRVRRDLLGAGRRDVHAERARVAREGWGPRLLDRQAANGRWMATRGPEGAKCRGLYIPKWTSTTYTMLLLARLGRFPKIIHRHDRAAAHWWRVLSGFRPAGSASSARDARPNPACRPWC